MTTLDFSVWDDLLRRYVDDRGRVNYRQWQHADQDTLNRWLAELSQIDGENLGDRHQQMSLWINLYNALTIQQILQRYPIASIQPKVFGIPNWIGFLQFFSRSIYQLGPKSLSLNQIEHGILRPQFNDPRIHFALVCASIGCPLLRNEAYLPDRLHTQLEQDADRFINNSEKVKFDSQTQTLYCSKIFKWYGKDFLKVAPSLQSYIATYLNTAIALTENTSIRYLNYDWNLNEQRL